MAKKKKTVSTLNQSYRVSTRLANTCKLDELRALEKHWNTGLQTVIPMLIRKLYDSEQVPRFIDAKGLSDLLMQRQWQSVGQQASAMMKSWVALAEEKFRVIVRGSSIDDPLRHELFKLNKAHKWYEKVSDEAHYLARRIMKQVRKRMRFPNPEHCHVMSMSSNIVSIEETRTATITRYWARITGLTKGKRILVPLIVSKYFTDALARGEELSQFIQVKIADDGEVIAHLVTKQPVAEKRTEGDVIALDWGLRCMFAVNDGRLEGIRIYAWLQNMDKQLERLTKELQRNGRRKLNQSRRYRRMNKRIREYVTNEVNRVLNRLTTAQIREIVVEELDFRGGGLSRRLNRIVNRAGRSAVRKKLEQLENKQGVTVTMVNPAYTSQECSRCGHVYKGSRQDAAYSCVCCGMVMNADVNAARVILTRRSRANGWRYTRKTTVHGVLRKEHTARHPDCVAPW